MTREVLLVYDEQCPFCDAYCRAVRIRESVGVLRLVDALMRKTRINNLQLADNERF